MDSILAFICSYLSDRKQRTKVNNSFSAYSDITTGVPQGSILGPLIFNIYLNDIFYFVSESNLTNHADDNTPYAIDTNIGTLITNLVNDISILITWFSDNYFKMTADKCKLLITNHEEDISVFPDTSNPHNLRNKPEFKTSNVRTVSYGTETLTWSLVPIEIKNLKSLSEFKAKIKHWKPDIFWVSR